MLVPNTIEFDLIGRFDNLCNSFLGCTAALSTSTMQTTGALLLKSRTLPSAEAFLEKLKSSSADDIKGLIDYYDFTIEEIKDLITTTDHFINSEFKNTSQEEFIHNIALKIKVLLEESLNYFN